MQGATVIDVNAEGKVTSWRDYLDTNEPMQQIQAGIEAAGRASPAGMETETAAARRTARATAEGTGTNA